MNRKLQSLINKNKIKIKINSINDNGQFNKLMLTLTCNIKGSKKVASFDWYVSKEIETTTLNLMSDITKTLTYLVITNFKYESFIKYADVDRKYFSNAVGVYKLFRRIFKIKTLNSFLDIWKG